MKNPKSAWVDFSTLPEGITPETASLLMLSVAKRAGLTWFMSGDPADKQFDIPPQNIGFRAGRGLSQQWRPDENGSAISLWDWLIWVANRGWEEPAEATAVEKLRKSDMGSFEDDPGPLVRDAVLEIDARLKKLEARNAGD